MKKLLLLALLIANFLFAKNINTINFEWTGLFPSLNLEYKFENTKFRYNILRFGLGKYNRPKGYQCSDCGGPGYIITPSLSIYKEKADNAADHIIFLGIGNSLIRAHKDIDIFTYNWTYQRLFTIQLWYYITTCF